MRPDQVHGERQRAPPTDDPVSLFSAALLLVLVMDPFGNVPLFLSVLRPVAPERRRRVIARELVIALGFMLLFLFAGRYLLDAIGIQEPALSVAGGIILFLIALRMVFPGAGGTFPPDTDEAGEEPLVVPLAVVIFASLGSILFGLATPTEAAAETIIWVLAIRRDVLRRDGRSIIRLRWSLCDWGNFENGLPTARPCRNDCRSRRRERRADLDRR